MDSTPTPPPKDRTNGVSRRTVVAAAWSAPVILAAVASPLAAASDGPLPTMTWFGNPGVFQSNSVLVLDVPNDSPAVGRPGTLTMVAVGYGSVPTQVTPPAGWTYTYNSQQTVSTFTPPAGGLTSGPSTFGFAWTDFSANLSYALTWQSSAQATPVTSTLVVGPRGFPSLTWNAASVPFGGTATLTLTVPANSYALGYGAVILMNEAAFPTGSAVVLPTGWRIGEEVFPGRRYFQTDTTVAGPLTFVFTFGVGTTAVPVELQWIAPNAPMTTPISPVPALQLGTTPPAG